MSIRKVAIIQARMTSSRLPGKVLLQVDGKPLLKIMLERVQGAKSLDDIVLATTNSPSDDVLEQFCHTHNIRCYRGSLHDVLDRYYQSAARSRADMVVRLTADCPLMDPEVLDLTVATFLGLPLPGFSQPPSALPEQPSKGTYAFDFAASRLPPPWKRTLPIGLDVEVCSFEVLQQAWKGARETYQREHVMPFLYEGVSFKAFSCSTQSEWYIDQGVTPRGFRIALLNHTPDFGALRWTVDTAEDLEFIREIIQRFNGRTDFTWREILALIEHEPELASINAAVRHKTAFDVDQRNQDD